MAKKENTEVVTTEKNEVVNVEADLNEWGDSGISSKDIIIPKILCMQGLSDLVADGHAKMGDFVDSLSNEVIGSIDSPVVFIPFYMTKVWIVSRLKNGESNYEFEKYVDANISGELPFEEMDGEDSIKNEYALQFYVLLAHDMTMPYVITFKSTSLRAGKVLSTQMYVRNRAAGLAPAAYKMLLGGKKEKNDKGTFVVMEVKASGKASQEEIANCLTWFKTVKQGNTKVASEPSESDAVYADDNVSF